jgi:hypothetical protein
VPQATADVSAARLDRQHRQDDEREDVDDRRLRGEPGLANVCTLGREQSQAYAMLHEYSLHPASVSPQEMGQYYADCRSKLRDTVENFVNLGLRSREILEDVCGDGDDVQSLCAATKQNLHDPSGGEFKRVKEYAKKHEGELKIGIQFDYSVYKLFQILKKDHIEVVEFFCQPLNVLHSLS